MKGWLIPLTLGLLLVPTVASAQARSDVPEECRIVSMSDTSLLWWWYCDDSGRVTYEEFGEPDDTGLITGTVPMVDGTLPTIAACTRVRREPGGPVTSILWLMGKDYGGEEYSWVPTGPNRWTARQVDRTDQVYIAES
jgi:hypothetical protein